MKIWSHKHFEDKCWRWWLHSEFRSNPLIQFEVSWKHSFWLLRLGLGHEEQQLSFTLGFHKLYIHLAFNHLPIPQHWTHKWNGRYWEERNYETGINLITGDSGTFGMDDPLLILQWFTPHDWAGGNEKRCLTLRPLTFLLGEIDYTHKEISKTHETLSLPDKDYPVTVEVYEGIWTRPRWPKPLKVLRGDVESEELILTGEEKYGEPDGIYSSSFPLKTNNALEEFKCAVERERAKYGYYDRQSVS